MVKQTTKQSVHVAVICLHHCCCLYIVDAVCSCDLFTHPVMVQIPRNTNGAIVSTGRAVLHKYMYHTSGETEGRKCLLSHSLHFINEQ